MFPSKASEGDFITNGLVSEDFTLCEFLIRIEVRPCLRRSGYAQAGRILSEEHTHVRLVKIFKQYLDSLNRSEPKDMLADVTSLIDGDDLKLCLIDSFRKGCFSYELAWVSSINHLKSF